MVVNRFVNEEAEKELELLQAQKYHEIKRFWIDIKLYEKYKDILEKRFRILNVLYLIYPEIEFQAESLRGWRTKLFGFSESFLLTMAPIIHYRILPNEIVIELDRKDKDMAMKVTKALLNLGAKPFVGFSGNRGYHIHIIIGPPNKDLDDFVHHPEVKEFTQTFYLILIELLKDYDVDIEAIDTGVMMASAHTIRSFYSINPEGKKWKTPVFGENYEVWYLPRELYKRVLDEMKIRRELKEILEKINQMEIRESRKRKPRSSRIAWIEKVLANPDKITDGRRRLIMYALVPYLLNIKGLDPKKVSEICTEWVMKTPEGMDSGLKSLIKSEIKSYTQSKVLPMAKEKFFERYPDLVYLREVLNL